MSIQDEEIIAEFEEVAAANTSGAHEQPENDDADDIEDEEDEYEDDSDED